MDAPATPPRRRRPPARRRPQWCSGGCIAVSVSVHRCHHFFMALSWRTHGGDERASRLRARHDSWRTAKAYVAWIRRFILFHDKRHPQEMGAAEVTQYLSSLATEGYIDRETDRAARRHPEPHERSATAPRSVRCVSPVSVTRPGASSHDRQSLAATAPLTTAMTRPTVLACSEPLGPRCYAVQATKSWASKRAAGEVT